MMKMDFKNQKDLQTKITCNVENCHYHGGKNCCTAGKIQVGPVHAISPTDTICATFKAES